MKNITAQNANDLLADTSTYTEKEGGCSFVGYVCIKDPCRVEVKDAIKDCKTAGITIIMITGDAKETAISIARELDILTPNQNVNDCCYTGAEFQELTAENKKKVL